jgi:tRNA G10  N-methylase Trm11
VRDCAIFDAIVCDPPYGVRAGARKTGVSKREPKAIECRKTYIIPTMVYNAVDVRRRAAPWCVAAAAAPR